MIKWPWFDLLWRTRLNNRQNLWFWFHCTTKRLWKEFILVILSQSIWFLFSLFCLYWWLTVETKCTCINQPFLCKSSTIQLYRRTSTLWSIILISDNGTKTYVASRKGYRSLPIAWGWSRERISRSFFANKGAACDPTWKPPISVSSLVNRRERKPTHCSHRQRGHTRYTHLVGIYHSSILYHVLWWNGSGL